MWAKSLWKTDWVSLALMAPIIAGLVVYVVYLWQVRWVGGWSQGPCRPCEMKNHSWAGASQRQGFAWEASACCIRMKANAGARAVLCSARVRRPRPTTSRFWI